jgi:hypothetical protein
MNTLGRVATALTISLALVSAGYLLGRSEPEPSLAAVALALIVAAVAAFLRSDHRNAASLVMMGRDDQSAPPSVVDREIARARRLQRPLAMLRATLPQDDDQQLAKIQRVLAGGTPAPVRLTDHAWVERGAVFIVFPDAGRQAAALAWARLTRAIPMLGEEANIVVFPEDGVTLGGLLDQLAHTPTRPASEIARELLPVPVEARTNVEEGRP